MKREVLQGALFPIDQQRLRAVTSAIRGSRRRLRKAPVHQQPFGPNQFPDWTRQRCGGANARRLLSELDRDRFFTSRNVAAQMVSLLAYYSEASRVSRAQTEHIPPRQATSEPRAPLPNPLNFSTKVTPDSDGDDWTWIVAQRERLAQDYPGYWIAVANNSVVAIAADELSVLYAAEQKGHCRAFTYYVERPSDPVPVA